MCGLASSAFARHYLRNHGCFLFLWVLRCFTSPRSLLLPYVFRQRSPDITPVSFEVSLFGDPRIEARLPAPRGLSQVTTSFIGSWCQGIHRLPLVACCYYKDARVHCEVLNIRAVAGRRLKAPVSGPLEGQLRMRPNPQDPTACLGSSRSTVEVPLLQAGCTDDESGRGGLLVNVPHSGACPAPDRSSGEPSAWTDQRSAKWLLRKEVIQPHLPVRLPCYDLVLIASPTFDGSLHKGWATGFGCYRLS